MRLFSAVTTAVALLSTLVLAAPGVELKAVLKYDGPTKPDSYIVKLKDEVSKEDHLSWLDSNHNSTSSVTYRDWQTNVFHGYAGTFQPDALNALRASPDVDYIEEDGVSEGSATVFQNNAPWGLQRISQNPRLINQNPLDLNFTFKFDDSAGNGVDIFIIDTGIYLAHNDFGGRAVWGQTFGPYQNADGHGHGTHVAGIAGSTTYGVSKRARLVAVKVLSDSGTGINSDIIAGMDWVAQAYQQTGRPSVANLSLGGAASVAMDAAAAGLVNSGVHTVVAAGNSNINAAGISPAREPSVITVGASNIADARWASSNWGGVLDIFAPGENIISLGITGPNSLAVMSGTSMAAPHVSGIIGTYITTGGNLFPANMAQKLDQFSLLNVLSNIPLGTVNKLARNEQP
ncbi:serine protease [Lentinus tigrinus ALCF2SS1-7]|uniref:Serine protease n=1 Tax=Lentinus tigrinus ALCF2SS1-6 TaxID=1328759 RepID=A0A5C2RWX1_9APHY|nr:serine protease [Lentinus tigrinus ALCF2SS1-6]RPD70668.1 serine protease [Lentinus tigrinus ALCF2SS1-7]